MTANTNTANQFEKTVSKAEEFVLLCRKVNSRTSSPKEERRFEGFCWELSSKKTLRKFNPEKDMQVVLAWKRFSNKYWGIKKKYPKVVDTFFKFFDLKCPKNINKIVQQTKYPKATTPTKNKPYCRRNPEYRPSLMFVHTFRKETKCI